jgi:hypothetical protein
LPICSSTMSRRSFAFSIFRVGEYSGDFGIAASSAASSRLNSFSGFPKYVRAPASKP